eukprot:CAMPEP_0118981770 /NCGR_PEP_ID=MMETSP1173-20130426/31284_1 /TAXON_ID=1034831 /ORGANISM="Rhizochromulina marina cf, Strain CCMP1243" /LENGTH=56 /DNA_ID=CAMNT_0006932217 /DNA_START=36 /DNA_END=202 /DNA_ORIENTATION=-
MWVREQQLLNFIVTVLLVSASAHRWRPEESRSIRQTGQGLGGAAGIPGSSGAPTDV